MLVKLMNVFEYDDTGWNCKDSQIANPAWEEIEGAIRRLDKFRFPFVWLFLSTQVAEDAVPEFEIMGGEGDYFMAGSVQGYSQRRFCNPSQGDTQIDLWTSDQGFSIEAEYVCHDIDLVLKAVKYFDTAGGFCPEVGWE